MPVPAAGTERHWAALARLVRDRRLELAIPSQKAAAERANMHVNTWNKVENGQPVRMHSLESLAHVLRWHPSYVMAILREGEDAPKHVMAGQLPALTAHVQGVVTEPESPGETVVAKPGTVRATSSIPGPAERRGRERRNPPPVPHDQASVFPLTGELSVIMVPIPLDTDAAPELTPDDLAWLTHALQQHGMDMVETIIRTKHAERQRRGLETTSEWPDMDINDDDTEGR